MADEPPFISPRVVWRRVLGPMLRRYWWLLLAAYMAGGLSLVIP